MFSKRKFARLQSLYLLETASFVSSFSYSGSLNGLLELFLLCYAVINWFELLIMWILFFQVRFYWIDNQQGVHFDCMLCCTSFLHLFTTPSQSLSIMHLTYNQPYKIFFSFFLDLMNERCWSWKLVRSSWKMREHLVILLAYIYGQQHLKVLLTRKQEENRGLLPYPQ